MAGEGPPLQCGMASHDFDRLIKPHVIRDGKKFRLADHDPADTVEMTDRKKAEALLEEGVKRIAVLQERLYAQNQWALLLIFQAMDAAGKDGTIKHVMSGINPQGCDVRSFKAPTADELDHDFMWRCFTRLPERGRIGIFNRSYYEETLVVRVHPEYLRAQHLPAKCITDNIWDERYEDINAFEKYLTNNGIVIRKFFLHVSKEEQRTRLLARLTDPEKNWKFSEADIAERARWDEYQDAYERTIRHTSTDRAPWVVVPADKKWYTRLVVAQTVIECLESLDLAFPAVDAARQRELKAIEQAFRNEKD